ncbi:MAG: hypothetical protein WA792_15980 [Pseudolabrys sp.]
MALNGPSFSSAFDAAAMPLAMPVWLAGAVAALFVAMFALLGVLAFRRGSAGPFAALLRIVAVAAGMLAIFAFLGQSARQERLASRHALEMRSAELTASALAPGSVLACLGGATGDVIESACEKRIFASPESAAAAVGYVAAELSLLADGLAEPESTDLGFTATLAGLRRAIALDRFGIAAHVLATRDGCTVERCPVFALLGDAFALKTNLKTSAFDNYVARYATAWNRPGQAPAAVAENPALPAPAVPMASVSPQGSPALAPSHMPVSSKYDFPSADSIPAVSIMNAEPKLPAAGTPATDANGAQGPKAAVSAEAPGKPPLPPRRPQTQGAAPAR